MDGWETKLSFPDSWVNNKSYKRALSVRAFRLMRTDMRWVLDSSSRAEVMVWWCALHCFRSHWWWWWWCTVWSAVGWWSGDPRSHCVQVAGPGLHQRGRKFAFPPILFDFLITHNDHIVFVFLFFPSSWKRLQSPVAGYFVTLTFLKKCVCQSEGGLVSYRTEEKRGHTETLRH